MTSLTPSEWQLALAVGKAVPFDIKGNREDYTVTARTIGVPVSDAYRMGGIQAAAGAAYILGYRAGEHTGQIFKAGWFQTLLYANLRHPPPTPSTEQRQWLADTAAHAREWVLDADRDVIRARNPHVPAGDLGPALQLAARHQDDGGLPRVAAVAFTLGLHPGEQYATEVTEQGIVGYLYQRASELGVELPYVDQTLHRKPSDRPAGFAETTSPRTTSAAEVGRLSFPQPASAATQPQPAPAGGPGRGAGASKGRHR